MNEVAEEMNRRLILILVAAICWACCGCDSRKPAPTSTPASKPAATPATQPAHAEAGALYREDFEKVEIGQMPTEFLALEGDFAVRDIAGNRALELPGQPLSSFGLLFGPVESGDLALRARFNGSRKGRKFPSFGVGLGGASGYRLILSAGKDALELYLDEELKTSTPYQWTPETWTVLLLQTRKAGDGQWKIEGKAWLQTGPEPAGWMLSLETRDEPFPGRASLWATPYSGTPIQFDDLVLTRLSRSPG
jgi:hypothetical protein